MCRVELGSPSTDWDVTWEQVRLKGLGPNLTSFLFKIVHQLLPTQERVARTNPNHSPAFKARGCMEGESENLVHALVTCRSNNGVGSAVMDSVVLVMDQVTDEQVLRLQFQAEESLELPVIWFLAVSWCRIWEARTLAGAIQGEG